jgi:hypothetical protein
LVPVGNFNNVDSLTNNLGCMVSFLHLKYFGLLLRASFKAKTIWDSVIEQIEHRLAG